MVPVKRLELAKTRLSAYGENHRQELALAFAADVILAAREVARVLVVTDDPRARTLLAGLGAEVIPDDPDSGLNPALTHGAAQLRQQPGIGVATLSADLPALRGQDLLQALEQVRPGTRGFVVDVAGTGTTLLAAGPGADLEPAFGPGSRAAHLASGAVELEADVRLRQDVDTPEDLRTTARLGVGPHTAAVLEHLG